MAAWSSLPVEILENILKHLTEKDAFQCQLTCREWEKTSLKVAYTYVHLFNSHKLNCFIRTIKESPKLPGIYVKRLLLSNRFGNTTKNWDTYNRFSMLVKHCPNVEVVILIPSCVPFYSQVMRERYEGNWKKLNSINPPTSPEEIEYYNTTILSMQKKIKSITICDQTAYSPFDLKNTEYKNIIEKLGDFSQLTNLNIIRHTNEALYEFDRIIDKCPTLKELSMTLYPFEEAPVSSGRMPDKITPNKNITKFVVRHPIRSEKTIEYIMDKFPDLEVLDLDGHFENAPLLEMISLAPAISNELLERLTKYAQERSLCTLRHFFAQNMGHVVRYLSGILADGHLTIRFVVEDFIDDIAYCSLDATIAKQISYIKLESKSCNLTLPFLNVLEEGGSLLHDLFLINDGNIYPDSARGDADFESLVAGYYLDRIFESCSCLDTLWLEKTLLIYCRPNAGKSQTIRELRLRKCHIFAPVYYQLSIRLPNLRTLYVEDPVSVNPDGNKKTDKRLNFFFDMPYSSLDNLTLKAEKNAPETNTFFHVKVSTMSGDFYYRGDYVRLMPTTHAEYKLLVSSPMNLTICVRCKSLQKITIHGWGLFNTYDIPWF